MLTTMAIQELLTQNAPGDSNTALPKINKWAAARCPEQKFAFHRKREHKKRKGAVVL